ncbi:MAG: efflux RND transporter permease subunit [Rickettsiales endosymbiont of Dermacentor nuttalli]
MNKGILVLDDLKADDKVIIEDIIILMLLVLYNISQAMAELSKSFPRGLSYSISFDITVFVNVSIKEVIKTLIEAIVLVVVYLFLQNVRANLIPLLLCLHH